MKINTEKDLEEVRDSLENLADDFEEKRQKKISMILSVLGVLFIVIGLSPFFMTEEQKDLSAFLSGDGESASLFLSEDDDVVEPKNDNIVDTSGDSIEDKTENKINNNIVLDDKIEETPNVPDTKKNIEVNNSVPIISNTADNKTSKNNIPTSVSENLNNTENVNQVSKIPIKSITKTPDNLDIASNNTHNAPSNVSQNNNISNSQGLEDDNLNINSQVVDFPKNSHVGTTAKAVDFHNSAGVNLNTNLGKSGPELLPVFILSLFLVYIFYIKIRKT